ncbi:MAG: TolB family protein, partial [Cytophagaceae bacterium]
MVPRNDQLIFTSARVNSLIRYTSEDKQPLTDIYCTQLKNGKWKTPVPFSMEINSRYNEGPISFDSAGNTVYFNRSDDNGKLKIFRSEFRNGQWQNIQELSINSNEYSLAHPSVSADGRTLFFSSDMPGGMGGKDLYVSFLEDGKWTVPENLGTPVNTSGNELFPFI